MRIAKFITIFAVMIPGAGISLDPNLVGELIIAQEQSIAGNPFSGKFSDFETTLFKFREKIKHLSHEDLSKLTWILLLRTDLQGGSLVVFMEGLDKFVLNEISNELLQKSSDVTLDRYGMTDAEKIQFREMINALKRP